MLVARAVRYLFRGWAESCVYRHLSRQTQLSARGRDQQEKITEAVVTNMRSATRLSAPRERFGEAQTAGAET
jgi:hypothetical protein